jgi:Xaa-Pro aminopeptidase
MYCITSKTTSNVKQVDLILIDAGQSTQLLQRHDRTIWSQVHRSANAVLRVKTKQTKCYFQTIWKQYHIEVGKLMTSELLI